MSELEKRYQEIVDTIEKSHAAKAQDRRENAAATEANRTLEEAEAQEIERRSMKCSSTAANQRGVPAQFEHRRQDGWTSTPCGSDGIRKDSEYDMTAGERLQEQRPHPIEKIKDEEAQESKEEAQQYEHKTTEEYQL